MSLDSLTPPLEPPAPPQGPPGPAQGPPAPQTPSSRPAPIASGRHTALLVGILLAIAAYGARYQLGGGAEPPASGPRHGMAAAYLSLIAAEWALLRLAVVGVHRRGLALRDLIGGRWSSPGAVARDVAVALGFWALWAVAEAFVEQFFGPDAAKGIGTLLPQGPLEVALWVGLSVSAGICEEAIFRGYLMRQLHALSGSAAIGLLGQGVIFGVSHGYQGVRLVITITAYGVAYGLLARWRRSLRPGMVAHAWQDIFSGILAPQR
jgi:CAAX protease family protein